MSSDVTMEDFRRLQYTRQGERDAWEPVPGERTWGDPVSNPVTSSFFINDRQRSEFPLVDLAKSKQS